MAEQGWATEDCRVPTVATGPERHAAGGSTVALNEDLRVELTLRFGVSSCDGTTYDQSGPHRQQMGRHLAQHSRRWRDVSHRSGSEAFRTLCATATMESSDLGTAAAECAARRKQQRYAAQNPPLKPPPTRSPLPLPPRFRSSCRRFSFAASVARWLLRRRFKLSMSARTRFAIGALLADATAHATPGHKRRQGKAQEIAAPPDRLLRLRG